MQIRNLSRPKKNVGNIETFLRRNYGRIHDMHTDNNIGNNQATLSMLKINETERRPISALRSFKIQKDKLSLDAVSITQRLRYFDFLTLNF